MKKRNIITIILGVLFVALVVVGIVLISKDIQISNEVAAEAERTKAEILALPEGSAGYATQKQALETAFVEYLNSKTPIQTTLTISSLVLIIGGIACFVTAIKRVSADIKAKKDLEAKESN